MITLPSPAKINWFLHIVGVRDDGYHDLETYFQFLELGDRMHFKVQDDYVLKGFDFPTQDNLITKAVKALNPFAPGKGVAIEVEKRLPMGGGIGGGSSNAATTLLALNHLWGLNLDKAQLMEIGTSIGADVPIFVDGHASFGEGIGEQLTHHQIAQTWILLVQPKCQISTKDLFASSQLTRDCAPCKISTLETMKPDNFHQAEFNNVFEPLVRTRYNLVDSAMTWLNSFSQAKMSGTGSCVFASFDSEIEANNVLDEMPNEFNGIVTRSCNVSPTHLELEKYT